MAILLFHRVSTGGGGEKRSSEPIITSVLVGVLSNRRLRVKCKNQNTGKVKYIGKCVADNG